MKLINRNMIIATLFIILSIIITGRWSSLLFGAAIGIAIGDIFAD